MYQSLKYILYANKIANKFNRLDILNRLDAEIAMQSFLVRFSYRNKYINTSNYYEWSKRLEEIGKICKRSTKRRIETSNLILYNWTRV